MAKYKYPCVFEAQCGGKGAGSREHTLQAALGGLRIDTRILCDDCQEFFSRGLDEVLPRELRYFCTLRRVLSRHAGVVRPAPVSDSATGHQYEFDDSQALSSARPTLVSSVRDDRGLQTREYKQLGSATELASLDVKAFVRKLNATEGKTFEIVERLPIRDVLVARPLHADTSFGGDDTFRAIARIALNHLATEAPELARSEGLEPFKRWLRAGTPEGTFVAFANPLSVEQLPPNPFEFGHRVALGFCATTRTVSARVTLFGVHELAVKFGSADCPRDQIAVIDIDPCAPHTENGLDTRRFSARTTLAPADLGAFAPDMETVLRRNREQSAILIADAENREWARRLVPIVAAINAAHELLHFQQIQAARTALQGELQIAFNLLARVAGKVARMLREGGHEGAAAFFDFAIAAEDGDIVADDQGVLLAKQVLSSIEMGFVEALREGPVTLELARDMLDGERGCRLAYRELLEACRALGLGTAVE